MTESKPVAIPHEKKHRWNRMDRPRECVECGFEEHDGSGIGYQPCPSEPAKQPAPPSDVGEVRKTMTVSLSAEEMAVLEGLMEQQDLSEREIVRQMLRLYQRHMSGIFEPNPPVAIHQMMQRLYEVVYHDDDCPAIGGRGDDDCKCDAVPVLRDVERMLGADRLAQTADLTARLERAREALEQCEKQFAFYCEEHWKAAKYDKAETNKRFRDIARAALTALEPRPLTKEPPHE